MSGYRRICPWDKSGLAPFNLLSRGDIRECSPALAARGIGSVDNDGAGEDERVVLARLARFRSSHGVRASFRASSRVMGMSSYAANSTFWIVTYGGNLVES